MVGISLLTLVPGVIGGSERYARSLVAALGEVGTLDYRVFTPAIAPDAGHGLPTEVVRSYRARTGMPGRIAAMSSAFLKPGAVRRELELDRLDAIHFPLSVMIPPVETPAAITSILDVQHEFHPQFFSRAERAYRRAIYGRTARRSALLIAISEHVKETLVERLRYPPERVRVIHLGVDVERFSPGDEARRPFLLYPANRWPHKNHDRLFAALELVRARRPDISLVLTGSGHDRHATPPGVDVRGRISDEELIGLYRTASALVFPSLYEGFGQPPIEAMACGCPVAAANATALPEACGDAARYFDPLEPESIAEAVLDVLTNPAPLVERGLARAAAFTWEECARRHEEAYRELLPDRRPRAA